jgi:CDP-diacylglycerol--glycerol-3-phosphate 3-phosphatidyltransferase
MNTTANKITIARIALIPVFLVLCYTGHRIAATVVFILASLSDLLDGYIARHYNQISNFGKFMDPLADKVLVLSAMCFLIERGQMPGWVVAIILFREFAVSGLRMMAAGGKSGRVIPANIWGKMKTVLQMISIMVFYFGSAVFPFLARLLPSLGLFGLLSAWLRTAVSVLCWVCAGVTIASGVTYFAAARDVLKE